MAVINKIASKWFSNTRQKIDQATSVKKLLQITSQIKEEIGADYYSLGTYIEYLDSNKDIVFIGSDTPQAWQDEYKKEKIIRHDIRIIKARKTTLPFLWSDIKEEDLTHKTLDKAAVYQLNHGITFPIHGPKGAFGFVSLIYKLKPKKMRSRFNHLTPYLCIISMQIITVLRKLITLETVYRKYNKVKIVLNKRQRECLVWAAEGKTGAEIALILNTSSSMVARHLEGVYTLLNANNRTQCIARALDQKLIALEHKKKPTIYNHNLFTL